MAGLAHTYLLIGLFIGGLIWELAARDLERGENDRELALEVFHRPVLLMVTTAVIWPYLLATKKRSLR